MIAFFKLLEIILFTSFGACIGSFLTMLTYRLPKKEDLVFTRSHCPKCKHELKLKSLIPIFSYLIQKGRCAECGEKISIRYFLIESINCIAYLLLFFLFGFNFTCIYLCLLFSLILSIIVIDIETMEIPLYLQFCFIVFAIIHILINPIDPLISIFNAIIYFSIINFCVIIVEKIKGLNEVIGGGDIKIITICGLFLTIKDLGHFLLLTGFIGCIFGILWKNFKKNNIFPFALPIVFSFFIILTQSYLSIYR